MEEGSTSNICIGGTFSPLHEGHRILLREAFKRGGKVWVGLTSDKMARRSRERTVLSYEERVRDLKETLELLSSEFGIDYSVREINDRYGFAVMEGVDSIVVSRETEQTVDDIDRERSRRGLKPLKRFVIDMVLDDSGKRISSTRISRGEIDIQGRTASEKRIFESVNRVCLHLGSRNPDKVRGAITAFRRYWPEVQVFQYEVGGSNQMMRSDSPLEGAFNRAEEVRERIDSPAMGISDYIVGIESGLMEIKGTWFMVHCCFVSGRRGRGTGLSSGVEIPPDMMESIMIYRGSPLETRDILGTRTTLIENMSGGSVSRDTLIEQSCQMALISMFNSLKKEEFQ